MVLIFYNCIVVHHDQPQIFQRTLIGHTGKAAFRLQISSKTFQTFAYSHLNTDQEVFHLLEVNL